MKLCPPPPPLLALLPLLLLLLLLLLLSLVGERALLSLRCVKPSQEVATASTNANSSPSRNEQADIVAQARRRRWQGAVMVPVALLQCSCL